jgi:hypothetical protein
VPSAKPIGVVITPVASSIVILVEVGEVTRVYTAFASLGMVVVFAKVLAVSNLEMFFGSP